MTEKDEDMWEHANKTEEQKVNKIRIQLVADRKTEKRERKMLEEEKENEKEMEKKK